MKARRIKFTRHASEKFELLKGYGFVLTERYVEDVIENPDRVDGMILLWRLNPWTRNTVCEWCTGGRTII